jgi:hypothetical protein
VFGLIKRTSWDEERVVLWWGGDGIKKQKILTRWIPRPTNRFGTESISYEVGWSRDGFMGEAHVHP